MADSPELPIQLDLISGLRPRAWLCVGAGFAREDIKSLILSKGRGFVSDAVTTIQELCLKILKIPADRVLAPISRQEFLRVLLAEPRVMAPFQELKRIKRQKNFLRRLDGALQAGRMTFAHPQEEEVYIERLTQVQGNNPVRKELQAFAKAYEVYLEASNWWDLPRLLGKVIETLTTTPSLEELGLPEEIWVLSVQNPESLEREFWDSLKRIVPVRQISTLSSNYSEQSCAILWEKWHTLDDAAEHLADQILLEGESRLDEISVLIPDIPSVRRSLRRALEMRGIPLAEPRDPTQLRWDESIKRALLPLQLVGRNFDRQKTLSWLSSYCKKEDLPAWVTEINNRGIRNGLRSYAGGSLSEVYSKLNELNLTLSGRKTCAEVAQSHLQLLDANEDSTAAFLKSLWEAFTKDMERVGQATKKAPLLFWLERFEARLSESSPPIEALKPRKGIRLYRLQQVPVLPAEKVWIFGLPARWLSGDGSGDYWFSEREREILSAEFAVRSSVQIREERLGILKSWINTADQCIVLDSEYDAEGRERESLFPFFKELALTIQRELPESPQLLGSHPRMVRSFSAVRPFQPTEISLPALASPTKKSPELTATLLDRYSRCSFQALAFHRWKLRDIREPDTELWPDVRGNILHESVRILRQNMTSDGQFQVSPREALNSAWQTKRPQGLIRSPRIESYVRSRLEKILEVFCEKEREYQKRSGTYSISLDDLKLRLYYPEFSIVGMPDRIEQHPEGLFVIDYKSSGTLPQGLEIVEKGYRLQLPFYALAAEKQLRQEVLGVQFVELDRKGARKSGIFFKEFNGKDPGNLTLVRSN